MNNETTELCPFCGPTCGSRPRVQSRAAKCASGRQYFVRCAMCHTEGPRSNLNEAEAIAGWNRRATPPTADSAADARDGIDYKLLLAKYIEHVGAEEGCTFTSRLYRASNGTWQGMSDRVEFSQVEKEAIEEAAEFFTTGKPA